MLRPPARQAERIGELLDPSACPHAVGQGAIGVQCREGDAATLQLLTAVHHPATGLQCAAERAFMRGLEGGCSVPLGVRSELAENGALILAGAVHSLDGADRVAASVEGAAASFEAAEAIGAQLADEMRRLGAADILERIPRTPINAAPQ